VNPVITQTCVTKLIGFVCKYSQ